MKRLRILPILSINFEEILSPAHGNFEEPNKVLESSTITINYRVFIIKAFIFIQLIHIIIVFQIMDSWRNATRKQLRK